MIGMLAASATYKRTDQTVFSVFCYQSRADYQWSETHVCHAGLHNLIICMRHLIRDTKKKTKTNTKSEQNRLSVPEFNEMHETFYLRQKVKEKDKEKTKTNTKSKPSRLSLARHSSAGPQKL